MAKRVTKSRRPVASWARLSSDSGMRTVTVATALSFRLRHCSAEHACAKKGQENKSATARASPHHNGSSPCCVALVDLAQCGLSQVEGHLIEKKKTA